MPKPQLLVSALAGTGLLITAVAASIVTHQEPRSVKPTPVVSSSVSVSPSPQEPDQGLLASPEPSASPTPSEVPSPKATLKATSKNPTPSSAVSPTSTPTATPSASPSPSPVAAGGKQTKISVRALPPLVLVTATPTPSPKPWWTKIIPLSQ